MKVGLTPDAAQWVENELAAGNFPTAEDAVRYAINNAKISKLRVEMEASELKGGNFTKEPFLLRFRTLTTLAMVSSSVMVVSMLFAINSMAFESISTLA